MSNKVLMVDVNSYKVPTNLSAYRKAGYVFLGIKTTEGTGYTWSNAVELAKQWHALGGRVVFYHFATALGTGAQQAKKFLSVVNPVVLPRDVVCLDIESQPASYRQFGPGQARTIAHDFQAAVEAGIKRFGPLKRKPGRWVYSYSSFLSGNGIRPLNGAWKLWVASYGQSPAAVPGWKTWTAWQFTDHATGIPGMVSGVDESHLRLSLFARLRRPPVLKPGDKGAWVRTLQTALNRVEKAKLDVDGVYGKHTRAAVDKVKKAHHWPLDGVVDARVWKVLGVR